MGEAPATFQSLPKMIEMPSVGIPPSTVRPKGLDVCSSLPVTLLLTIGFWVANGLSAVAAQEAGTGRVLGSVFDSTTMVPLGDARVAVLGTNVVTTTASDGSFTLDSIPAGSYWVSFYHDRLGQLGVSAPSVRIELSTGAREQVALAVPSNHTLLAAWCLAEGRGLESASVAGMVTDSLTGVPLPAAIVTAAPPRRGAVGPDAVTVRADGSGYYRICDVPAVPGVRIQARFGRSAGRSVIMDLDPGAAVELDLVMLLSAEATLQGVVVDPLAGSPVSFASVSVLGTTGQALTDEAGRFLIGDLPPGRHLVVTDHLGFEQRIDSVTLFGQETVDIEVRLAQEAIQLEGFVVTARSRFGRSSLAGDDKRADYITREQIEELLPRTTSTVDLLRNLNAPGLRIREVYMEGPAGVRMPGHCIEISRRSGGQGCQPAAVFINDVPVPYADQFIMDMDPSSIQSIEVLSPTDAQFQFGTLAGNGAILIYTR